MEEVKTLHELGSVTISELITWGIYISSAILITTLIKNIPGLFNPAYLAIPRLIDNK